MLSLWRNDSQISSQRMFKILTSNFKGFFIFIEKIKKHYGQLYMKAGSEGDKRNTVPLYVYGPLY